MAPVDLEARLQFLRDHGIGEVEHDSHAPFLAHLAGTHRVLESWGARDALCDAGLFHSIYGTEFFDPHLATPPARDAVVALIGAEAERIAWLWCNIERETLDPGTGTVRDRRSGETLRLSAGEAADLVDLWIADTVEQIRRMAPEERAFARELGRLRGHAMPAARRALDALADVLV